jgi:hypothetical protein
VSYLRFTPAGFSDSGKTRIWSVTNTSNEPLGIVSWYAPWRRYTARLNGSFDVSCLREVAQFIETEMEKHKHGS